MFIKHDNLLEEITYQDILIKIYSLKKLISEKKKINIDEIHILKVDSGLECYDNNDFISCDMTLHIKIIKNRCSVCLKKSATIVGDCQYCLCKYCLNHRLPEVHKCPEMDSCRKESFDKNYNTVISQKCVATMI